MKKKFVTWCSILALLGCFTLSACGGGGTGDVTVIEFRCNTDSFDQLAYVTAVKAYNNGQGKIDGVKVNAAYNVSSGGASTLWFLVLHSETGGVDTTHIRLMNICGC